MVKKRKDTGLACADKEKLLGMLEQTIREKGKKMKRIAHEPSKLKVKRNDDLFDELQNEFLTALILSIRDSLRDSTIKKNQIPDVTAEIAFQIATMIDGSSAIPHGKDAYCANIGFARRKRDGQHDVELIIMDGGSWMHEYVYGRAEEICNEND